MAARWIVSGVSVVAQVFPSTRTPPMHSTKMLAGDGRTVPVMSAPAGLRIVWLASTVTSNPFMLSDP